MRPHGSRVLEVPATPPSANALSGRTPWAYRKAKRRWQADLELMLMARQVPRGLASVMASAVLRFPRRRRRDEGNFRYLVEKALGDALVNGGWLPDDTPDRYRFAEVRFDPTPGPPRTLLVVTYLPDDGSRETVG